MPDLMNLKKSKIKEIYCKQGAGAAKKYIYDMFRTKLTSSEIREILGIFKNNHGFVIEAHQVAWSTCGWSKSVIMSNGNYKSGSQGGCGSIHKTQAWDAVNRGGK